MDKNKSEIIYQVDKKQIQQMKNDIDEKRKYHEMLYKFYQDIEDDACMRMTQKGYRRFLNHIINKKNTKIVDKAIKYLAKEQGLDAQILNFIKPSILESFSDYAAETYAEDLMGC